MKGLFIRKLLKSEFLSEQGFKRHLGAFQLTTIGIGAIIGAGIFVITGQAAAEYSGPAILLSFVVASIICLFAGLCYAELAALIPISGGSYSYSYFALGELPAWIVGWCITMQYLVSSSTVAVGFSGYFTSFLKNIGITIPEMYTKAPFAYSVETGWQWSGAILNIPAVLLVALITFMISTGIKAAARFNHVMVATKLLIIVIFLIVAFPHIQPENWTPFIPENTGVFGEFGWSGILRGAGLLFFAYIGFDTVSTLAQDAKNPQKDLPIGILGSLSICTLAYIAVALALTGIVSYKLLDVPDPMAVGLDAIGPSYYWVSIIVKFAILAGLSSVVLVQLLGQTRVFFAISKDGLLPPQFSKISERLQTPLFASVVTGILSMVIAGFFSVEILGQLVSITTLFIFALVCFKVLVLRRTHPGIKRPFKVPFVPYIPALGVFACIGQMCFLPLVSWMQLLCWILLGFVIYFVYGRRHSLLRVSRKNK